MKHKVQMEDLIDINCRLNALKSNLLIDWANDKVDGEELKCINVAIDELNYQLIQFMLLNKKYME